jgi:tetratricopeptide (TPR) repeat protein
MCQIAGRWPLLVLAAAALAAPALCEQAVSLTGEVILEGGLFPNGMSAEIYDPVRGEVVGRAPIKLDGSFALTGPGPGAFVLRVLDPGGNRIQETVVSLPSIGNKVEIRLPAETRSVTGVVSLKRLEHKVPAKAIRELKREEKALKHGDLPGSIAHLQAALRIDPDCMEAHNNLGVRYMTTGDIGKAAEEFQTAATLDPAAADALLNWAGALYVLHRFEQAEDAARKARALGTNVLRAEYMLGLTLLAEGKPNQECLDALERAAPQYPRAKTLAAGLRQYLAAKR